MKIEHDPSPYIYRQKVYPNLPEYFLFGGFRIKNRDFPPAEEISARLKRLLREIFDSIEQTYPQIGVHWIQQQPEQFSVVISRLLSKATTEAEDYPLWWEDDALAQRKILLKQLLVSNTYDNFITVPTSNANNKFYYAFLLEKKFNAFRTSRFILSIEEAILSNFPVQSRTDTVIWPNSVETKIELKDILLNSYFA